MRTVIAAFRGSGERIHIQVTSDSRDADTRYISLSCFTWSLMDVLGKE